MELGSVSGGAVGSLVIPETRYVVDAVIPGDDSLEEHMKAATGISAAQMGHRGCLDEGTDGV